MSFRQFTFKRNAPPKKLVMAKRLKQHKKYIAKRSGVTIARNKKGNR